MAKKKAAKQTTPKTTTKKAAKKSPLKKKASASGAKKAASKKTAAKKAAPKKAAKKAKPAAPKAKAKSKKAPKSPVAATTTVTTTASAPPAVVPSPTTTPAASATATAPAKPTKVVAVVLGKHPQGTFPEKAGPNDFECFGPPAMRDGEFENSRVCDMGCFTQDGKDSNKYYHAAVVRNKESHNWYAYFEWGRTGAARPSFQFVGCRDEAHAVREYASQLHSKNDRRGEWITIAGIRTLRAKKGKDCYLVRPQATRSTGLPDARSIKINEGAKQEKITRPATEKKKIDCDPKTLSLMKDLAVATLAYTRGSMADQSLPTQTALDEARQILTEAQQRLGKVGNNLKAQVKDKQLGQLTALLYGRIPKRKPVGAGAETWVLSQDNILTWQNDLDAFESALYSTDIDHEEDFDPFEGMQITMEWIDPESTIGSFLLEWWPKATNNRHGWIKSMEIKNLWKVERHTDRGKISETQEQILKEKPAIKERPLFQKRRADHTDDLHERSHKTNTALLFHGTRSVNVSGILRESLRLPKQLVGVVITGAMFGPGIYFADDWKKSAGYTSLRGSYWAGGTGEVRGRDAFMFACDVVLGEPYVAPQWGGYTGPPQNHHSIYGKSGASGVQNNEFIVFDTKQAELRYLAEFRTK